MLPVLLGSRGCICDVGVAGKAEKNVFLMSRSFSWKHLRRCRPSRVLMSRHTPPWLQVVGHAGNFQVGECGRLLKRFCPREQVCYLKLMDDGLRSFVPTYYGVTRREQQDFNVMDNLLTHFHAPAIMDCKMGSRTYLEEELQERPQPRRDMYLKMVAVDPAAPTGQEREQQAVLKTRYMQWRESLSSTTTLGFRVEGFRKSSGECHTSFKRTRSREQVMEALGSFVDSQSSLLAYLKRLKHLRNILEESQFFKTHEVVGSSLLFVHDPSGRTGVWMIDFGKTVPLPPALTLDHRRAWMEGNHEDGYLWGLDNLIDVMTDLTRPVRAPPTCDPQE